MKFRQAFDEIASGKVFTDGVRIVGTLEIVWMVGGNEVIGKRQKLFARMENNDVVPITEERVLLALLMDDSSLWEEVKEGNGDAPTPISAPTTDVSATSVSSDEGNLGAESIPSVAVSPAPALEAVTASTDSTSAS